MSKAAEYKEFVKAMRSTIGYWKSYSLMQFTSSLAWIMKRENVQGKGLAARLGISPTQVSKVLSGEENITVETMARFANALDAVVHIHVAKRGVQVQWQELPGDPEAEAAQERRPVSPLVPTAKGSTAAVYNIRDYIPAATRGHFGKPTLTRETTVQTELRVRHG